ncbi:bacteriophage holin [Natrinema caseinilyticum]|uniref:bacteriophage holin n=1 Tax=Natrinema caseinilyticum TaxID=2961570 RepID=UPI0020C50389|nr:bacteriophage holin [Natrinema caseinilyticum]
MSEETAHPTVESISQPREATQPAANREPARLDPDAFGLACGLFWAGAVALLGLTARFGWGERWEQLLADMYRGFSETLSGLLIGAAWAFVDAFTSGYVFAWSYNRLLETRR